MHIQLADDRKKAILLSFNSFSEEAFNETLSDFQAERLLDFFCQSAGPSVYNQDMHNKLEDLDANSTSRKSRCE